MLRAVDKPIDGDRLLRRSEVDAVGFGTEREQSGGIRHQDAVPRAGQRISRTRTVAVNDCGDKELVRHDSSKYLEKDIILQV